MALLFARSAHRHGISQSRVSYVLDHYVWTFEAADSVTFYVGPDRNGIDLEVSTALGRERSGDVYVIHAMELLRAWRAEYHRYAGL